MSQVSTLRPLIDRYLTTRRRRGELNAVSVRNLTSRLATLDRSFGARPIGQFGPAAVRTWLEDIGHLSPATRRAYLSTVRTFGRWLIEEGIVRHDPTRGVTKIVEPRRVPRAINGAQVAALLAVCHDSRSHAIVALMVGCGLRCIEVARLGESDYDERAGTISVRGKGDHERVLPVPTMVARALSVYRAEHGRMSGPLIRSKHHPGSGLSRATVSLLVSRLFAEAGLKRRAWDGRSAHALRHTALSDVLDQCNDLRVVQAMAGHQNLATTSIYLRRASLGQMREAMEGRDYQPVEEVLAELRIESVNGTREAATLPEFPAAA